MKKIISVILCICLLLSNFSLSVFATDSEQAEPTISVEVVEACMSAFGDIFDFLVRHAICRS